MKTVPDLLDNSNVGVLENYYVVVNQIFDKPRRYWDQPLLVRPSARYGGWDIVWVATRPSSGLQ
jgi:hypothetical protein